MAIASEKLSCPEQQRLLLNATEGMLYPSESDYPFSYFLFPQLSSLPSPQSFAALTGQSQQSVTQVNFDDFFRQKTRFYPGMSQQQILTARRFRVLEATLRSNYRHLTVYRVGQI
ncbi:MAG: nuclease A inhibitor family protein [Cyanosarcina radialis HA8281-LM2]|nr:nuclease A inhibitor family protein [Cyanosarcina radialis HA8281-LM2]